MEADVRKMKTANRKPGKTKILLVDDNEELRKAIATVLEASKFLVTTAANVGEALHLIDTKSFDVLLTDLHMPEAGDGFTVVSAMRHTNPNAVTLVFSGYPALQEAAEAILLQADEVLLKPIAMPALITVIREQLVKREVRKPTNTERVASILERDATATINDWLDRVDGEDELTGATQQGAAHRSPSKTPSGTRSSVAGASKSWNETGVGARRQHGKVRQSQGYSISMIVEESRILQVSIFHTLQKNLSTVNFSLLLTDVMTIADECDSQLKQTLNGFMTQAAQIAA